MRHDLNPEGLTFEEWVLAAGKAKFGHIASEGIYPYTTSDGSRYTSTRHTTTHYSRHIRKAWREGEDPTEYRA